MKAFFLGFIAFMLLVQIVGLGPILRLFESNDEDISELLPPLRSPLYRPGERDTAMAVVIHDECTAAANAARRALRNVSPPQAEYGGYLACYVDKMLQSPEQLCDADTRNRLIRYTRGYFGLLASLKSDSENPAQQEFIRMQRRMERRTDIDIGNDDFSPDSRITEGWKTLVSYGTLAKDRDLPRELKPEVPRELIDTLTAIKPQKALCP